MNSVVTVLVALGLIGFISSYVRHARQNRHSATGSRQGRAVLQVDPAACIGCGKCQRRCRAGAITIEDHVAHIYTSRCRQCRHCIGVCPKHAISVVNAHDRKACAAMDMSVNN